ncbi:MAG: hypothetical protein AAGK09_05025 [Planctomycetota bacterium]
MLVYRCADLMFSTRVRAAADDAGLVARPVRSVEMLRKRLERVQDGKANDAVTSMIVEVDGEAVVDELIAAARAHDPTLRIVAFGPHVAVEALQAAGQAGADPVLTRGSFHNGLPGLMERLRGLAETAKRG